MISVYTVHKHTPTHLAHGRRSASAHGTKEHPGCCMDPRTQERNGDNSASCLGGKAGWLLGNCRASLSQLGAQHILTLYLPCPPGLPLPLKHNAPPRPAPVDSQCGGLSLLQHRPLGPGRCPVEAELGTDLRTHCGPLYCEVGEGILSQQRPQ